MIERMAREPERYRVETLEQLTPAIRDMPLEIGPPRIPTSASPALLPVPETSIPASTYPAYSELRSVLSAQGWSSYLEAHHILEQRFAEFLDIGSPDLIPSVPLLSRRSVAPPGFSGPVHRIDPDSVTLQMRALIPHGDEPLYSLTDVWVAHREVYRALGEDDWLEAIWPYFEELGVVERHQFHLIHTGSTWQISRASWCFCQNRRCGGKVRRNKLAQRNLGKTGKCAPI